jgi:quercetin dioxygenase-like cupin family protein
MSTQLLMRKIEERNRYEKRVTPNKTLFEFLTLPEETGEICLIRGTIPPGATVPLHSHSDVEIFYVIEGWIEAFQSGNGSQGWRGVGPGKILSIPGNTKHALRNRSTLPVTMLVVTTRKLYSFFQEITRPLDPDRVATPPTSEEIQKLFETAAGYGYWMGSPEENAAIGLSLK